MQPVGERISDALEAKLAWSCGRLDRERPQGSASWCRLVAAGMMDGVRCKHWDKANHEIVWCICINDTLKTEDGPSWYRWRTADEFSVLAAETCYFREISTRTTTTLRGRPPRSLTERYLILHLPSFHPSATTSALSQTLPPART